jgi:lantibiotic biosynthesis protein
LRSRVSAGNEATYTKTARDKSPNAVANGFVLRTPTLPWETIEAWSEGLRAPTTAGDDRALEAALECDAEILRARLRQIVGRPMARGAFYVASLSLYARLESWLADSTSDEARRAEAAIVRYVMRMAGRATPYGLFATSTVGAVGERTCLDVPDTAEQWQHSRLDFEVLLSTAERISSDCALVPYLTYHLCEETFRRAGQLRSIRVRRSGLERAYDLVETAWSSALSKVLEYAGLHPGASGFDIASHLVAAVDTLDPVAALDFVADIADAGLLRTALGPSVTSQDALAALAGALDRVPQAQRAATALLTAREGLAQIDRAGHAPDPSAYEAIANGLREFAGGVPITFHVDRYGTSRQLSIAEATIEAIADGVELLRRIGSNRRPQLTQVVEWFSARFGEAEVPLLEYSTKLWISRSAASSAVRARARRCWMDSASMRLPHPLDRGLGGTKPFSSGCTAFGNQVTTS